MPYCRPPPFCWPDSMHAVATQVQAQPPSPLAALYLSSPSCHWKEERLTLMPLAQGYQSTTNVPPLLRTWGDLLRAASSSTVKVWWV